MHDLMRCGLIMSSCVEDSVLRRTSCPPRALRDDPDGTRSTTTPRRARTPRRVRSDCDRRLARQGRDPRRPERRRPHGVCARHGRVGRRGRGRLVPPRPVCAPPPRAVDVTSKLRPSCSPSFVRRVCPPSSVVFVLLRFVRRVRPASSVMFVLLRPSCSSPFVRRVRHARPSLRRRCLRVRSSRPTGFLVFIFLFR